MRLFSAYLLRVISAAMFGAVLKTVVPEKGAGKVLRLAVGMVMVLTVLSPVLKIDADEIASYLARMQIAEEHARTGVEIPTEELTAQIISRRIRTYVLDKATELGATIEVEVSMHTGGAYPYPEAIHITGAVESQQRQELQRYIEASFAIPADRQVYDQ